MEHRWGQRIALDRLVRLTARPLALGIGRIRNLSLSGAWISTNLPLAPGALVHLIEEHPPESGESGTGIEAFVVRGEATGIGIEWCEVAPERVLQWLRRSESRSPSDSAPRQLGLRR
jgi:hypothetical protein